MIKDYTDNNGAYPCDCGGHYSSVIDSRPTGVEDSKIVVRRRRRCYKCGKRITTYEVPAEEYVNLEKKFKKHLAEALHRVFTEVNDTLNYTRDNESG